MLIIIGALLLAGCHRSGGLVQTSGIGQIEDLDFGRVVVGETAAAPLLIVNLGGGLYDLSGAPTIGGTNSSDFLLQTAPPTAVPDIQSVSGVVSFAPQRAGPRSAEISAKTDSRATPSLAAALTGTGVDPQTLTLTVNPMQLDFGSIDVGSSKTLDLTVVNNGTDDAPLQPLTFSGPNPTVFSVAPGQGGAALGPLAKGSSLTLAVTFIPAAWGTDTATLEIRACHLCTSIAVPLSGTGLSASLAFVPASLTFAGVGRGQASTQAVALVNSGNAPAMVAALQWIDGGLPFSLVYGYPDSGAYDPFPGSIPPGQSVFFGVDYHPPFLEPMGQADRAVLEAQLSAAAIGNTPGLSVIGVVGPNCQLSAPNSLFFGYAVPPYYSPSQTLMIANSGADACSVSQFTFGPGSDPGFHLDAPAPAQVVVPAKSTAGLNLLFAPANSADPWLREGTLTMQSADPAQAALSVALSGYTQATAYAKGSAWPKWCRDNGNSCLSDVDTSNTGPTVRWRTSIAPGSYSVPVENYWSGPSLGADGTLYQLGADGLLYAVASSGNILWSSAAAVSSADGNEPSAPTEPGVSTPTIGPDGPVLVSATSDVGSNQYFGFASDGGRLWAEATASVVVIQSPSLRPDGVAMFPLGLWSGNQSEMDTAGVASYSGESPLPLTCPGCWNSLGVIAPDGTSYWNGGSSLSQPVIQQVFPDGGLGWTFPASITCGSVAVTLGAYLLLRDSELYVSGEIVFNDGGTLSALGVFDITQPGQIKWQYCNYNDFLGGVIALAPDGGAILAVQYGNGGSDAGFARVDPPGVLIWENTIVNAPTTDYWLGWRYLAPAVGAEGTIYFTCDIAPLIALNGADGGILWELDAGARGETAPIIGPDGTIYYMDHDGYLNAVR
jgi:hypothetical protein